MSCGKIKRAIIISKDIDKNLDIIEIDKDCLIDTYLFAGAPVARAKGNLERKSYYLNKKYNWIIVKDDENATCLVPLKKT